MTCPVHPQSIVWHHPDGDRCSICGYFYDGREPRPAETQVVRSFAHYRELVDRTDSAPHWPGGRFPLEYHAGCLNEEAGEFFGNVKKVVYHGHARDEAMLAKMREEAGDCLWYLDRCAERIGATLEQIAAENIRKLERRYPNGFSKKASADRQDPPPEYNSLICANCQKTVFVSSYPGIGDIVFCMHCQQCFTYTHASTEFD